MRESPPACGAAAGWVGAGGSAVSSTGVPSSGSPACSSLDGNAARRTGILPATNELGGLWYTEARLEMWQMSSSSKLGSRRSVSSDIKGFSANTTSFKMGRNQIQYYLATT